MKRGKGGGRYHADNEELFQGLNQPITILSLSLGGARYFGWRPKRRRGGSPGRVRLGHGDIATMEGWTQYYYEHGVLDAAPTAGPRINLTWRWIARHEHAHPNSATTAE